MEAGGVDELRWAVMLERRAADALASACDAAVRSGYIGSRSEIADALLNYRDTLADTRPASGGERDESAPFPYGGT